MCAPSRAWPSLDDGRGGEERNGGKSRKKEREREEDGEPRRTRAVKNENAAKWSKCQRLIASVCGSCVCICVCVRARTRVCVCVCVRVCARARIRCPRIVVMLLSMALDILVYLFPH